MHMGQRHPRGLMSLSIAQYLTLQKHDVGSYPLMAKIPLVRVFVVVSFLFELLSGSVVEMPRYSCLYLLFQSLIFF